MNIFVLHKNAKTCATYHCDKHCIKQSLETAQMLCTVHWQLGNEAPYKPTHRNHPCNIWLMQSIENYNWLTELGLELCKEYTFRYGKTHKCEAIINWCIENKPSLPSVPMTAPALAMPDECKVEGDTVLSYRNYYIKDKKHLHSWKSRSVPEWINKSEL
jgi:hypothetical protein